jgi:hypothetical protein
MLHRDNFDLPSNTRLSQDDGRSPLHILLPSYGLAATAAIIAAFAGIGLWPSMLMFWLGGAATTVAMALVQAGRAPSRPHEQLSPELNVGPR